MADTRDSFARALLARLGAPASSTNLAFLGAWFAREGTKAANNPLATTLDYGTNTKFNSVGVRNYADFNTGVEATARTLTGGYPRIVSDLKAGNGAGAAVEGAELRKWSGGGYSSINIIGIGPITGSVGQADGGGSGPGGILPSPDQLLPPGVGGLPDLLGGVQDALSSIGTGWVKDLVKAMLPLFLEIVFVIAGLALVSMGLHRLTGRSPVEIFNKANSAAGAAASSKALLAAV